MKSLSQLLSPLMVEEIIGSDDKIITDVVSDSRKVTTGSLFVAVRGTTVDGHSFIPLLQYSGVAAIVCEEFPEFIESSITYIKVSDSAVALGYLASEWWDNPSRKLNLVGVTGTNGKTTTATLIY
ncbi:Mur ligase domain-containing protein, partial [uncultured Muribaculum sp.]